MKSEYWNIEIDGEVAKLSKNHPPTPNIIKLTPNPNKFDEEGLKKSLRRADIPERYIPLIVRSHKQTFELPTLQFIYKDERNDGHEIMEYIRQFSEYVTGRAMRPKDELIFDLEFEYNGFIYHFFSILLSDANFGSNELVLNFVYDFYVREPK